MNTVGPSERDQIIERLRHTINNEAVDTRLGTGYEFDQETIRYLIRLAEKAAETLVSDGRTGPTDLAATEDQVREIMDQTLRNAGYNPNSAPFYPPEPIRVGVQYMTQTLKQVCPCYPFC